VAELLRSAVMGHPLMLADRSVRRAARLLGASHGHVYAVLSGKLRISVALADRFEEVFAVSAIGLLEAQAAQQLAEYRAGKRRREAA
jgi:plasmid maintenance system antidote protein VapI